jgi:hypothetical protein
MSKRATRWRAAAAKALHEASSVPEGSYRDIIISTADAYSRLADEEERRARAAKARKTKSAEAEGGP